MKTYITSDLHFFHANILNFESMKKYRGNLYNNIEEMNEAIITSWNEVVKNKDTVIIAGDFLFGHGKSLSERLHFILKNLSGDIILVKGNHDPHEADKIWKDYDHTVVDYLERRVDKNKVCISHYPFAAWNRAAYGSVMLHGHTHGSYHGKGRVLDVGWDVHGRLLNLEEAYYMAMEKEVYVADAH